jgi:hypothetical protein
MRPQDSRIGRAWPGSLRSGLLLLLIALLLAGCASVPKDYPRTDSSALRDDESTAIGRYVAKVVVFDRKDLEAQMGNGGSFVK